MDPSVAISAKSHCTLDDREGMPTPVSRIVIQYSLGRPDSSCSSFGISMAASVPGIIDMDVFIGEVSRGNRNTNAQAFALAGQLNDVRASFHAADVKLDRRKEFNFVYSAVVAGLRYDLDKF